MRVSTSQIYTIANVGMRDAQAAINKTNSQMASGQRVLTPADDPVAATQIMQLTQQLGRLEQFNKNIDVAENKLSLEEVALDSITSLVQGMQELAVSAGNTATLTPSEYKIMAAEVDSRIKELLNLQNTKDSSGQYIFAGYQSAKPAYVEQGGSVLYQGDDGSISLQVSESVTIQASDPGRKVFEGIATGRNTFTAFNSLPVIATPPGPTDVSGFSIVNQAVLDQFDGTTLELSAAGGQLTVVSTPPNDLISSPIAYTPGTTIDIAGVELSVQDGETIALNVTEEKSSIMQTLTDFRDAMLGVKDTSESKSELADIVAKTLGTLNNTVTRVGEVQSEVGARLNTLDATRNLNADSALYTTEVLGSLRDLDYAEATTRLKMQELVLSAAQQSFAKVSRLSLFNYL